VVLAQRPALAAYDGRVVAVGIRPEHVEDAAFSSRPERIQGKVEVREGLGSEVILHVLIDAPSAAKLTDDSVASLFLARVDPHTTLQPDDTANLTVDTPKMHFFDVDSGLAIRG
jgi:multiple sugar transport system ATP-binding protein